MVCQVTYRTSNLQTYCSEPRWIIKVHWCCYIALECNTEIMIRLNRITIFLLDDHKKNHNQRHENFCRKLGKQQRKKQIAHRIAWSQDCLQLQWKTYNYSMKYNKKLATKPLSSYSTLRPQQEWLTKRYVLTFVCNL